MRAGAQQPVQIRATWQCDSPPCSPGHPVLLQAAGKPQPDPKFSVSTACPATSSDRLIFSKWSRHQWILQILKEYPSAWYATSECDPPPRPQPFKLSFICLLVCSLRSADCFDYLNIWKLSHAYFDPDHLKYYPAGLGMRHSKETKTSYSYEHVAGIIKWHHPKEKCYISKKRQTFSPPSKAGTIAFHNINSRHKKKIT